MTDSAPELVKGFSAEYDKLGFSAEGAALRTWMWPDGKEGHVCPLEDWMATKKEGRE